MAVAGAIADATALTNIGAGIAAVGLAASSRYQPAKQSNAYFDGYIAVECVRTYAAPLTDEKLQVLLLQNDAETINAAAEVPQHVTSAVSAIQAQVWMRLRGISSVPPSKETLMGWATNYTQGEAKSKSLVADVANATSYKLKNATVPDDVSKDLLRCGQNKLSTTANLGVCVTKGAG